MLELRAPLQAHLAHLLVRPGDTVHAGQVLLVLEAMKMEHEVIAPHAGVVQECFFAVGEAVAQGDVLLAMQRNARASTPPPGSDGAAAKPSALHAPLAPIAPAAQGPASPVAATKNSATVRPDLARALAGQAFTLDANRPAAVTKRHALGLRTARENLADLCDAGSFSEYGALAVAAQSQRRSQDDLARNTPADGMVCGTATVGGAPCVVMAYDATVLAGTQGMRNHQKTDRMLGIALAHKLPVVLFAEGGGGRPGDVDMPIVAGLHVATFASFARLNGQVPVLGIAAGRCFAGNAALLGCCDVVIATRGSNIGMGGPAMVEGGGLGVFTPEQIGPSSVQHVNGVIDLLMDDEAQAVAAAKHYLGFFTGASATWQAPDALALRAVVPENRLRVYDTRAALHGIADVGSVLELRSGFGVGIHTALARIEGRAVGVLANNPQHLGGAIDADAADKATRFMQLCNAHGLPLVSLVDTPGFMVGPDTEATAQVRHVSRMFVAAAHLRVPFLSVVLRKGYGLGAMAMTAGGFHAPLCTVAWPSAEFGAMGLDGAVRLGFKKELEAAAQGAARDALFAQLLAQQVENGSALAMASGLEIDAVIDPADTRSWLVRGLAAGRVGALRGAAIDTW